MICIRCQHDSKYPERKDTKACPNCSGKFAFEPRENDPFTDMAFQKAIDNVSASGQVKWGVEHLYFELCRKKRNIDAKVAAVIAIIMFSSLIGVPVALAAPLLLLGFVPLALWLCYFTYQHVGESMLPRGKFEQMWDRWGQIHGKPKGVIVRRPQDAKPTRAPEPDLGDYSFDRTVICDRARTVDLLLANNFHFENNCAVLSVGGYPQQAFETVRRMLRRNPRLEVFVLHDITLEGCRLAHRLVTDPEWFKGTSVRIVDVGLRPAHAGPFKKLLHPAERPAAPGGGISPEEARWLSKHTLELAVIRPEQVVKRLFRAMSKNQLAARAPRGTAGTIAAGAAGAALLMPTAAMAEHPDPDELVRQQKKQQAAAQAGGSDGGGSSSGGFEVDLESFSADADSSDGGADSFG